MSKRATIIKKLEKDLKKDRFNHTIRTEKIAVLLARHHGVSVKAASIAALLHDYARKFDRQDLLKQAKKFKLKIDTLSQQEPKLLHAELSTIYARSEFGIKSTAILSAIRKHTVGSAKMTKLEKIIYLADHLEEGRSHSGLKRLRQLAMKNLDQAIVTISTNMVKYLIGIGALIHPGTIQTRNYYLNK